jgi:DNA-binding transcriptional LysR family regulator
MDKSGVSLDWMRSFVRVAERGSLSAVAREFGIGQSTITRHLHDLEQAVGVPLLSRTTRNVTLTDEGRRYHASATEILRLVDEARAEARGEREASAGIVRLSCSAFFGLNHVCRMIFAFQDRYPDIRVDLGLTDERIDMVRDGVDLAIHMGPLTESMMKLRPLGQIRLVLVAAAGYLAERGRPQVPADLATHDVIRRSNIPNGDRLSLTGPNGEVHLATFRGRLRVDHGLAAREALSAGRGIAPVPRWLVDDLLMDGTLEVVLPDYSPPLVPLSMLIVPERAGIARVRLLKEYLAENIRSIPGVGVLAP